jgi:hypothetical protein
MLFSHNRLDVLSDHYFSGLITSSVGEMPLTNFGTKCIPFKYQFEMYSLLSVEYCQLSRVDFKPMNKSFGHSHPIANIKMNMFRGKLKIILVYCCTRSLYMSST